MPKLLAYLPCEKVVIEEESRNISVLSILETVNVTLARGAPAPAQNASIGMAWAIFTLWQKEKGEAGELLAETPAAKLGFGTNTRQQVVNRMASFPVGTPGACLLKLMVKTTRESDYRELASVVVMVRHTRA